MPVNLYDLALARLSVAPAVRTNGTVNGTAVNLGAVGGESAVVLVLSGAVTDGSHAVTVEESANGTSGWAAVAAGRLQGSLPTITTANANTLFEVGVMAAQPFLRVVVVTTGATSGGLTAAVVVIGNTEATPVTHT